jgi:DNA-binding CsgD family transcriptional regulator/tetratricopeptide (TPR) repeat protein
VSPDAPLTTACEALEAGDWTRARDGFEAALAEEESPEALAGLGTALWWLQEADRSIELRERAYAAHRRRGEPMQAALIALGLVPDYGASLGNIAAAQGWVNRAARLVDDAGLTPLRGWVALCRAAVTGETGDPWRAEALAREALAVARSDVDVDLELCAMSELGAQLVTLGRVADGVALLDEAMAGALGGEGRRPETAVYTSCKTITVCTLAAELKRAAQWIRAADRFNRRIGVTHLYVLCRTHHGAMLMGLGRWEEAENELATAIEATRTAEPAVHAHAVAQLAELRLAQGRIDAAARLLEGLEEHPVATHAFAALRLARGEAGAAGTLLRRRLRAVAEGTVGATALIDLLVEADVAQGDLIEAGARAHGLAEVGARSGAPLLLARGERALGRVRVAAGDHAAAVGPLETALEHFAELELPLEGARTRLLLARALAPADRDTAVAEARTALAAFEALGAGRDADGAAAFARELGAKAARSGPRGIGLLTKRELEVLELLGEGMSNQEMADRFVLTRKTVENHVASVLAKLGLRGRAEAASYAARHLER